MMHHQAIHARRLPTEMHGHVLPASVAGLVRMLAALAAAARARRRGAQRGSDRRRHGPDRRRFAAPLAFIEITEPSGVGSCSGTLISPTVVMTAAHCVYDTTRRGNLVGVARPSEISVRVGSRNVADSALGARAGVVAVLPQPYFRWDGSRHNHDVALLALDRALPQTPACSPSSARTRASRS